MSEETKICKYAADQFITNLIRDYTKTVEKNKESILGCENYGFVSLCKTHAIKCAISVIVTSPQEIEKLEKFIRRINELTILRIHDDAENGDYAEVKRATEKWIKNAIRDWSTVGRDGLNE